MDKFYNYYLYLTVFVTGATVLMLEILGTRIIGPYFGSSLYVWSSLISITILSLAIGYFFGGWLADKRPKFSLLYTIILLTGLAILIVPRVDSTVLVFASSFGVRFGSLIATFILFTIPMVLLGMIDPFAIKLRAHELQNVGMTAGGLFGIATIGGFVGAILTGFFLIPSMGIEAIITSFAILLFVLSGLWFLVSREFKSLFVLVLFMLLPGIPSFFIPSFYALPEGGDKLLYKTQSVLGEIKVVDKRIHRVLLIDGSTQAWAERGDTFNSSSVFAQKLPFIFLINPDAKEVLVLGLGSGLLMKELGEMIDINVDTVDIDPNVLYVAREYFGFDGSIYIEDARTFIRNSEKKYDAIIFDIAQGDGYSVHNFTQEAFQETKNILNLDGIIAINFSGHADSLKVKSIFKTLESVFDNVFVITGLQEELLTPKFFFATDHEIDKERIKKEVFDFIPSYGMAEILVNLMENYTIESMEGGVLVTDDYNPLDYYQAESTAAWRKSNWEVFGDLLLN
ncbi:fused MFS/spermidine synthase [Patescibacteria group bacterium]|nr:fused MFS/spermidine synthase [Patescibacteria group bacterium]